MNSKREKFFMENVFPKDDVFNNFSYEKRKESSYFVDRGRLAFIYQFFTKYKDLIPRRLENDFWEGWGNNLINFYLKEKEEQENGTNNNR